MKRYARLPLALAVGLIIVLGLGFFSNMRGGLASILLNEDKLDFEDEEDVDFEDEEDFDFGEDFDLKTLVDRIELDPDEALIKGRVVDSVGNPVSLAKIKMQDTTESYQSLTNTDGYYYILSVTPGSYTAIVSPPPLSFQMNIMPPKPEKISLQGGKKTTKDFTFLPGKEGAKTISGSVKLLNGQAVTDAKVLALQNNPFALLEKNIDVSGQFSFTVPGGSWIVTAIPKDKTASTWQRSKNIEIVKFEQDETPESAEINLIVSIQDATITGRVKNPDGSVVKKGTLINFSNTQQYSKEIGTDGNFSVAVASGVYSVSVITADANTSAPDPVQVTVESGQTLDVGEITLIRDTGRIQGEVKNTKTGKGVGNVVVNVSDTSGSNFQSVKTGDDGSYSASVSLGDWLVAIEPPMKYVPGNNNVIVNVSGKEVKTADFGLQPQLVKLSGNLVNEKGKFVNDVDGYVLVTNKEGENFGGDISSGAYSFNISAGTYSVRVVLAPDAPYSPGNDVTLTVGEDETAKQFNIKVDTNKYEISGNITDEQGKRVNVKVRVFGSDSESTWQQDEQSNGSYSLNVSSGTWNLGCTVIDSDDYFSCESTTAVDVKRGNVTKNIIVKRASSTISGSVKDPQGNGLAHVYVSVDGTSLDPDNKDTGKTFVTAVETDNDGNFSISVPKGTYYLHAYQQARRDLVNPGETAVTLSSGQTQNVTFTFQKAEVKVSGSLKTPDGKAQTQAVVSAWSENGGYAETKTDAKGAYTLSVSPDTWHIAGSVDKGGKGYESSSSEVTAEGGRNYTLDIVTIPTAEKLATPVAKTISAGAGSALELKDGVSVLLPSNSTDTKGKLILSMNETVETRDQGRANVLGAGYSISLRDSKGATITELIQPMVLTFPYKKDELKAIGSKAQNLVPSFWDESVGAWKKLENAVIDAKHGVITATSRHLTRFALVAPADETPPPAPTAVSLASKNKAVVLSWKITKISDYHHSKVYRSDKAGVLGALVVDNITKNTAEIKGDGKYLYVVRSVDLAGNESTNLNQVSLGASKPKVKR